MPNQGRSGMMAGAPGPVGSMETGSMENAGPRGANGTCRTCGTYGANGTNGTQR